MKRFLMLVVAVMALALPAAQAQRINLNSELNKLAKVDAAIENVKKNTKASTWIARGQAYADAYMLPTKDLGRGVPVATLQLNVGQPNEIVEGELQGVPAFVCNYDYIDVYLVNGLIEAWVRKAEIAENLPETAIESFAHAYELDPSKGSRISNSLLTLANALAQEGEVMNIFGQFDKASYAFELAFRAQAVVPSDATNYGYLYNAGMLQTMYASTLTGEEAVAAFARGAELLNEAVTAGYVDEEANIYYYLFHCYYGQKDADSARFLPMAKEALLTGIGINPRNTTILDGLMQFYTAEEGVGDPAELTEMIEASLAADPENYDLWFGRGRVYNALKDYEECVNSFMHCVELRPEDSEPYFYTGYFIVEKANVQLEALNSTSGMSYQEYQAQTDLINQVYSEAIPWMERAYELDPTDTVALEYLNMLCFRVRDTSAEMQAKYEHYHALYQAAQ